MIPSPDRNQGSEVVTKIPFRAKGQERAGLDEEETGGKITVPRIGSPVEEPKRWVFCSRPSGDEQRSNFVGFEREISESGEPLPI